MTFLFVVISSTTLLDYFNQNKWFGKALVMNGQYYSFEPEDSRSRPTAVQAILFPTIFTNGLDTQPVPLSFVVKANDVGFYLVLF